MKVLPLFLSLLLADGASGSAAPPSATPMEVRAAVQRSLPYIEKVGTAWMRERRCNSCHTVTFMIWSHNEAAARGVEGDRAKLTEWTNWSLADSLADHRWFKLRPASMEALTAADVPEEV